MTNNEPCPGLCTACELDCEFQMADVPTIPEIAIDRLLDDVLGEGSEL
jgi:hypothetical protein